MSIKLPPKKLKSSEPVSEQISAAPLQNTIEFISILEAIHIAKVSSSTMRRWLRIGLIPKYRAGTQIRIVKGDLIRFIMQG